MQAIRRLLGLGQLVLGPEAPNPTKFLFRNTGDVILLSVARPSTTICPLNEESIERALELPIEDFMARPTLLLQTFLDHSHWSYSNDLLAMARLQARRHARQSVPATAPSEKEDRHSARSHNGGIAWRDEGDERRGQDHQDGAAPVLLPELDSSKANKVNGHVHPLAEEHLHGDGDARGIPAAHKKSRAERQTKLGDQAVIRHSGEKS